MDNLIFVVIFLVLIALWNIEEKIDYSNLTEAQKIELQNKEAAQKKAEELQEQQKQELLSKTWGDLERDEIPGWVIFKAIDSLIARILFAFLLLSGFAYFFMRSHENRC